MANKKVFTIKIDGIEKAYDNTIKLRDAIKAIDNIKLGIAGNINIVTNNIEQNLGNLSQASITLEQSFSELTHTVNENTTAAENNAKADATKTDSIKGLKKTLEGLQKEYENLSEAERKSSKGTDLLIKIKKLTTQIEIASDKNYGYVKTLNDISKATNNVNSVFTQVSSLLKEGSSIAQTFGVNVDSVTTIMNGLETAISTVSTIQKVMNTVNTIATVVQQGLNQAIKANPIMAMVSALILVVTTLYSFITATNDASEASDKNAESTDRMNKKMEETNELHKKAAESAGKTRQSYEELRKKWKELKTDQEKDHFLKENKDKFNDLGVEVNNVRDAENLLIDNTDAFIASMNARAMATAAQELAIKKYTQYLEVQMKKESLIAEFKKNNPTVEPSEELINKGLKLLGIDIDVLKKEADDALDLANKKQQEIAKALEGTGIIETTDSSTNKKNNSGNCNNSKKKKFEEELNSQKELEEGYEKLNTARENLSSKNIEREEKERKANAKTVEELKEVQNTQLNRLKEFHSQEIKQTEETYDKLIKIAGDGSKEAEALGNEKAQHIEQINKDHANTLKTITADNQKEQVDLLTKGYDEKTKVIIENNAKIAELEKDKKETKENGNIDVEGTKKNLVEIGKNLENQKTLLEGNEAYIASYYDGLALIYTGDAEKTEENEKLKQKALAANAKEIKNIQNKIGENTKESSEVIGEYYKELATKITDIATKIKENVATIFSAMSDMLKGQVEEAKENFTNVTKQYDAVVEKKKESQDKLKSLEEEAKTASGGRAMVVQEQIARQMEANDELAAQEKDLAKQKEKAEKEKAKKEKQQKKVELAQKLISVVTDTATAISKSVVASPITFGLPWSAFAAATGAIQTATIIKQMSKLEDGGMLRGKRHSQGGMRIEGTNIEVEGNEYVVNRVSTSKNLGLIDYINRNRKELRAEDLNSYFALTRGDQQQIAIPTKQMYEQGGMLTNLEVVDSINSPDNDKILEAISQINFKPVVSVVDITSAQNNLSEVKDIAGA